MRGRSETLEIGPWIGGLNVRSDPYALGDEELTECLNVFIDVDGSLVARPPFQEHMNQPPEITDIDIIGRFMFGVWTYLVLDTNAGLYLYDPSRTEWHFVYKGSGTYTTAVAYRDWIYVSGGPESEPLRFLYSAVTGEGPVEYTLDPSIPKAWKMIAYKARLWAVDFSTTGTEKGSRLHFSNIIEDVATWDNDFFDINPTGGDPVRDLTIYNDDLLIIKRNSTYVLVYDDLIANAFVRQISSIGGSEGKYGHTRAVVTYQNNIFILTDNKLYELSGYNYIELNVKVPFKGAMGLSLFEDHLYISFREGPGLVYSLLTKTWSRWLSEYNPYVWETIITRDDLTIAVASSMFGRHAERPKGGHLLVATLSNDIRYASLSEQYKIKFRTKFFNFGDNTHYKKLKYWMLSLTSNASLGEGWPSTPIVQLKANIYDAAFPANEGGYVQSDVFVPVALVRTVAKALKTLRFKTISFEVEQEGIFFQWNRPRFYGITALVSQKQTVDRKGN